MSTGAPAKHARREKQPSAPVKVNQELSSIICKSSQLDLQEPLTKHIHNIKTIKAHELTSFLRAFAMCI